MMLRGSMLTCSGCGCQLRPGTGDQCVECFGRTSEDVEDRATVIAPFKALLANLLEDSELRDENLDDPDSFLDDEAPSMLPGKPTPDRLAASAPPVAPVIASAAALPARQLPVLSLVLLAGLIASTVWVVFG